jgi:flagellar protein FliO/FliZ
MTPQSRSCLAHSFRYAVLAMLGTLPAGVWAADKLAHALPARTMSEPLGAGNLLQLTFGLLVVLAAIVGSAWLLRRYGRLQSGVDGALRVIGGLSMGPRERVVLVQVGKQQLLLGVAPGRIQTLHVLEEPVVAGTDTPPQGGFAERLATALVKK